MVPGKYSRIPDTCFRRPYIHMQTIENHAEVAKIFFLGGGGRLDFLPNFTTSEKASVKQGLRLSSIVCVWKVKANINADVHKIDKIPRKRNVYGV